MIDEKEQKRLAARGIVERMNAVTKIWDDLDYYARYKQLREENAVVRDVLNMPAAELIRMCFNIHPTISQLRKRIADTTNDVEKASLQEQLAARIRELEILKSIRDGEAF